MNVIDESYLKERLKPVAGYKIEYDYERPPRLVTLTDKQGNLVGVYHVGYFMQDGRRYFCPDFDRPCVTGKTGPNDGANNPPGITGETGVPRVKKTKKRKNATKRRK